MVSRARRYPQKSAVLHLRIQPGTLAELKKAADRDGRTVSAQAEHELHRALSDMGTGRTFAIMQMVAKTIDGLVGKRKWWDDPVAFSAAAAVVTASFELLRPPKEAPPKSEPLGERSARFAVEATLREIQTADLSAAFGEQRPYQRWLALMKQGLGDVADRPSIWGVSADEARRTPAEKPSRRLKK